MVEVRLLVVAASFTPEAPASGVAAGGRSRTASKVTIVLLVRESGRRLCIEWPEGARSGVQGSAGGDEGK